MENIEKSLAYVSLFEEIAEEGLDVIAKNYRRITYPAGNMIVMSEDMGGTFYVIEDGRVKISLASDNLQEVTISLLGPGDFFGEMSILDESPRAADVVALSDVKLLVIQKENFIEHLHKFPSISINLLRVMCERLRKVNKRVRNKNLSSNGKVIQALLEVADEQAKIIKEGILLPHLTHQEWAFYADVSRETFTRSINALKKTGLVLTYEINSKQFVITDPDELRTHIS
ncbi:MAG: Crp/Fnr family transcriptional regulator [Vampirovibrionia bacterium]